MKRDKTKTREAHQQAEYKASAFSPRLRAGGFLLALAVFCWPILYLFGHVFPVHGQYTIIGNDFIVLYYKYKVYLLANLAEFRFPLWSPSEAAGFPFYTSPFAQVFYPFNALLVVWYKIFGGYSTLDHQLFTVLGISVFALGLFMWLRLVNSDTRAVVVATFIMSVSFKVTELVRFPNAVHSAAWYPWVLYALTRIMLGGSIKEVVKAGALLILFGVFLCTAGYPYYVYYAVFLVLPYLLAFLVKPLRAKLFGEREVSLKRAVTTLAASGLVTLLLCGPYLMSILQLMSQTIDRAGKDFKYSTQHIFNFEDTVGSLVYPPASSTEGWYFFSITALLIIAVYLFGRRSTTIGKNAEGPGRIPADAGSLWVKLFFVIWIGLISYISYGRYSYLFVLLWKYMPGFSSLRVWGRLNIILVPILAWLLSIAYSHFTRMINSRDKAVGGLRRVAAEMVVVVTVYAFALGSQLYLHLEDIRDPMWKLYFTRLVANEPWFIIYGAVAFVTVLVIMIVGVRVHTGRRWLTVATVFMVLVAAVEMRHTGAQTWVYPAKNVSVRFRLDVAKLDEASFRHARVDVKDTISLTPVFNVGIVENWYFARYVSFLQRTANESQARNMLLGVKNGTKIFFSESIEHSSIESFLQDTMRDIQTGRIISYDGDELQLEIQTPKAGYLSFIDNWAPGWKAWVDDQPTQIELLFGTFKSVRLAPGRHTVKFSYQPGLLPVVKREKGS
jgi:hypothetical protein